MHRFAALALTLVSLAFPTGAFSKGFQFHSDPTGPPCSYEEDSGAFTVVFRDGTSATDQLGLASHLGAAELTLSPIEGVVRIYTNDSGMVTSQLAALLEESPIVESFSLSAIDSTGHTRHRFPGRFVVRLSDDGNLADFLRFAESEGITIVKRGVLGDHLVLQVGSDADLPGTMDRAARQPGVVLIDPEWIAKATAEHCDFGFPNDNQFDNQWPLQNGGWQVPTCNCPGADIGACQAWGGPDGTTGSSDVLVCVIDTGVDMDHADLVDRIIPRDGDDWNLGNIGEVPNDTNGHGTAVATLAVGTANNSIHGAGVAPTCSLLPLRIDGLFEWDVVSNIVEALDYARSRRPDFDALVINGSFAVSANFADIRGAVQAAYNAGCAMFFAAGNAYNSQYGGVGYPAAYDWVEAVGATDACDKRIRFNNEGGNCSTESVDWASEWGGDEGRVKLMAAGEKVPAGALDNGWITNFGGTSSASPIVAGVAALVMSRHPSLSVAQLYRKLEATARDQVGWPAEDLPGMDDYMGYGRVDAGQAIYSCEAPCIADAPVIYGGWGNPNSNYGTATYVFVAGNDGGMYANSFCKFDLSCLPPGAVLTRATLCLYYSSGIQGQHPRLKIGRVSSSWNEYQITWNNQPPADDLYGPLRCFKFSWEQYDVTSLVAGWIQAPSQNLGLRLSMPAGDQAQIYYNSREASQNRPYLELMYELPGDYAPPQPDPMTWQISPRPTGPNSVEMQATEGYDPTPPVEYYFRCAGGAGGHDRPFDQQRYYADSGLQPNTQYTYLVRARDGASNEGQESTDESVTTHAATPPAPTVDNPTENTLDVDPNPGGNPAHTELAILNATGGYWVTADGGNGGTTKTWRTDAAWGTVRVRNLQVNTPYLFAVVARNTDGVETSQGPYGSGATLPHSDNEPPQPDPSEWEVAPRPADDAGTESLFMVVRPATDESNPIQYTFDCVSEGCNDRNGGTDVQYTDVGLLPNIRYTYRVYACDAWTTPNCTARSVEASAFTEALVPYAPLVGNETESTIEVTPLRGDDNPQHTELALFNETDAVWIGLDGAPRPDPEWHRESGEGGWGPVVVQNLLPDRSYCFKTKARNGDGVETGFSQHNCTWTEEPSGIAELGGIPDRLGVFCRPNPSREQTRIRVDLPLPGSVQLAIYDVQGRRMRTLWPNQAMPAGRFVAAWDGRDDVGVELGSGVYYCHLTTRSASLVETILRLR